MNEESRYCIHCGAPLAERDLFCATCGARVTEAEPGLAGRSQPTENSWQVRRAGYRSLGTRATWARVFLAICAVLLVASIFSTWAEINLLERMTAWPYPSEQEITGNDTRQSWIGFLYLAAFAGSAVAFCVWVHGASSNLHPLGVDSQRFSPGWAVGWWFVPVMWLFRPYQVMSEIWRGSDARVAPNDPSGVDYAPNSPLMGWWWALWLISNWVGWAFSWGMWSGETVEELIAADWFTIVSDALTLPAAVLAFLLVSQITRRQEEKYQRLSHASP